MGETTSPTAELHNPFRDVEAPLSEARLRRERDAIVRAVADGWSIPTYFVTGRQRGIGRDGAKCAAYLLMRLRGWSYPRLGRAFGRDHSTIKKTVDGANWRFAYEPEWRDAYLRACAAIKLPGVFPAPHDGRSPASAPGQGDAEPTTPPR